MVQRGIWDVLCKETRTFASAYAGGMDIEGVEGRCTKRRSMAHGVIGRTRMSTESSLHDLAGQPGLRVQLQYVGAGRVEVRDAAAHLRVVHFVVVLAHGAVARDPRERVEQTRLEHARRVRVAARLPAPAQHAHQLVRPGHRLGPPARVRLLYVLHYVLPERVPRARVHPPAVSECSQWVQSVGAVSEMDRTNTRVGIVRTNSGCTSSLLRSASRPCRRTREAARREAAFRKASGTRCLYEYMYSNLISLILVNYLMFSISLCSIFNFRRDFLDFISRYGF